MRLTRLALGGAYPSSSSPHSEVPDLANHVSRKLDRRQRLGQHIRVVCGKTQDFPVVDHDFVLQSPQQLEVVVTELEHYALVSARFSGGLERLVKKELDLNGREDEAGGGFSAGSVRERCDVGVCWRALWRQRQQLNSSRNDAVGVSGQDAPLTVRNDEASM